MSGVLVILGSLSKLDHAGITQQKLTQRWWHFCKTPYMQEADKSGNLQHMSSSMVEFLLLAAIALFIGWRLYVTLGQDDGPPEGRSRDVPNPAQRPAPQRGDRSGDGSAQVTTFTGPNAAGFEAIYAVDKRFDPRSFMQGARAAYEMIVAAYARGDRAELKPLLDIDVYEAWDAAISEREAAGNAGMALLRIRKAEITNASLDQDDIARVTVQFESELGDGETSARASELWTFKRKASSNDPNWLLDDVDTAN